VPSVTADTLFYVRVRATKAAPRIQTI